MEILWRLCGDCEKLSIRGRLSGRGGRRSNGEPWQGLRPDGCRELQPSPYACTWSKRAEARTTSPSPGL